MIRSGIGKRCATRQDLSLKNGPDSCRPGMGEFRVDVFVHLVYILFADDRHLLTPESNGMQSR
jgi:hypothetical protein